METRTNIVLDDDLVEKAMAKAGVSTKKAAIEHALRAYVSEPDWDFVRSMEGSRAIADDYDPSALFEQDLAPVAAEPAPRRSRAASKRASTKRGRR